MVNIIKYELKRTKVPKLVFLGIILISEILLLIGIKLLSDFSESSDGFIASGITGLLIGCLGLYFYLFFEAILLLNKDLKSKQGYMVFMTPNSKYKILGGKAIMSILSMFLSVILIAILVVLNTSFIMKTIGVDVSEIPNIGVFFNANLIIGFIISAFAGWTMIVGLGFIAVILSKFMRIENSGLRVFISVLIFLGGNFVISRLVESLAENIIGPNPLYVELGSLMIQSNAYGTLPSDVTINPINSYLVFVCLAYLILAAVFFTLSGWILDKKMSI